MIMSDVSGMKQIWMIASITTFPIAMNGKELALSVMFHNQVSRSETILVVYLRAHVAQSFICCSSPLVAYVLKGNLFSSYSVTIFSLYSLVVFVDWLVPRETFRKV